jgi:hypothetical protein
VSFDPPDPRPRWGEVGIHGLHRLREWDVVVTLDAPGVEGDEHELLVLDDVPPAAETAPFAAALVGAIEPPYRAHAIRRDGSTWAVGARRIEVVELQPALPGNELVLSFDGQHRILEVDGTPASTPLPELEQLAAARHRAYVVAAARLSDTAWEVRIDPL